MENQKEIIDAYNRLAQAYAEKFCSELDGKPFDRDLLRRFAADVPLGGRVCDLGCGPGHVAEYLRGLGLDAVGVDLSPEMVAEARRRYPLVEYRVGDMAGLEFSDDALGGITAFYSIIHIERDALQDVFREMRRVVRPGGLVLVSFHRGRGFLREENVLDKPVSFRCTLFEPDEVSSVMQKTGFTVRSVDVRKPYAFEYPTERVYVLAKK